MWYKHLFRESFTTRKRNKETDPREDWFFWNGIYNIKYFLRDLISEYIPMGHEICGKI